MIAVLPLAGILNLSSPYQESAPHKRIVDEIDGNVNRIQEAVNSE
jgi:hypothetical protein